MKRLRESVKNKQNLIPSDYNDRISSLLAGLPDEIPESENTEAVVIKQTSHFDIRPIVSAAAAFIVVSAALLFSYPKFSQTADKNKKDNNNTVTSVTTSALQETACVTTTVSKTDAVTVSDTVSVSDNLIITDSKTEITTAYIYGKETSEASDVTLKTEKESPADNIPVNTEKTDVYADMPDPAVTEVTVPVPQTPAVTVPQIVSDPLREPVSPPDPEPPVPPEPPVIDPPSDKHPEPAGPGENHRPDEHSNGHAAVTPWVHDAKPYHPEEKNAEPVHHEHEEHEHIPADDHIHEK